MTLDLTSRKKIRQEVRTRRNSLSATFQQQSSALLVQQLSVHTQLKKAKKIALYLANDGELDPLPLIHWCWQQNIKTYLPVIHPFSQGNLLFLEYKQTTKLKKNIFGIPEPELNVQLVCPAVELDIIFTPLVAFDYKGDRLGMGGGFYDRTLADWHKQMKQGKLSSKTIKFTPIGLAHDCQQVDNLPTEFWDIPLPEIITPTRKISCKL